MPGERFDPRDIEGVSAAIDELGDNAGPDVEAQKSQLTKFAPIASYVVTGEPQRISLPAQRSNASWTHVNGSNTHQITHPALGRNLNLAWSVSIGQGSTRRARLTADPVVSDNRIFTMDSLSDVRAYSTGGQLLWQRNLTPSSDRPGEAAGGGLAVQGGQLFVTTGYGALHALDVATGAVQWTQRLESVPNSAPTVSGDFVYVTSRNSQGWALDTRTGRVRWQVEATDTGSVVIDGASPAIAGRAVVFPFGSGDLIATLRKGGLRLWSSSLTGERLGKAYASVSDITADPVVVGNTIYVGTPGGRLAALNAASGDRIWTAPQGGNSPVWPAGGSLFLVSDQAELLRVNASNGETIWSATLPLFTDEKIRRRRAVFAHFGPVLAGGRLIIASTDGLLREVDPASGQLLRSSALPGPAAANPVVAGGTLYVLTANGQLSAFR